MIHSNTGWGGQGGKWPEHLPISAWFLFFFKLLFLVNLDYLINTQKQIYEFKLSELLMVLVKNELLAHAVVCGLSFLIVFLPTVKQHV